MVEIDKNCGLTGGICKKHIETGDGIHTVCEYINTMLSDSTSFDANNLVDSNTIPSQKEVAEKFSAGFIYASCVNCRERTKEAILKGIKIV